MSKRNRILVQSFLKDEKTGLPIIDLSKMSYGLCANLIHMCDAFVMRRTIERMRLRCQEKKRNVTLVSIHDCVLICPDLVEDLIEIYNEELVQASIWAHNTINELLHQCGEDTFQA